MLTACTQKKKYGGSLSWDFNPNLLVILISDLLQCNGCLVMQGLQLALTVHFEGDLAYVSFS